MSASSTRSRPSRTTLSEAIRTKEYEEWLQWLKNEAVQSTEKCRELQKLDERGWSALHYAAKHYREDILNAALEVEGVNFNVETSGELTPLLVAASCNRKNAVLWLLQDAEDKIQKNAVDAKKRNAIHLACLELQCQYTIEPLVRQLGDELCFQGDEDGNTPLHLAAKIGNMQAIESGLLNAEIWDEEGDEKKTMISERNNDGQTPLHLAVKASKVEVVETVLKELRTLQEWDAYEEVLCAAHVSYSPMMVACKEGSTQVVRAIFDDLKEVQDEEMKKKIFRKFYSEKATAEKRGDMNCFELVIEGGHRQIAEMIIESDCWEESLRNVSRDDDGKETTPFRRLIKHKDMSDVAHQVMDKCSGGEDELEFVRDFCYGDDNETDTHMLIPRGRSYATKNWGPRSCVRENQILAIMVDLELKDLLKHPMIVTWLNQRWNNYGVWLYLGNLLIYLLYLGFLTGFALFLPNPQSDTCTGLRGNQSDITSCGIPSHQRNFLYLAAAVTFFMSVVRLFMEMIQFIGWYVEKGVLKPRVRTAYFKDWTNWVEVPLFITSIIFTVVAFRKCICPVIWQWQLGTIVIFFAWIDLLTFLYKFPKFGLYLLMMQHIIQKFIRVIVIAVLFSLAFGFAFYMTFYDPNIPASPFADPWLAIMKIFSMTAGGPDDSIFRFSNMGSAELDQVAYPALAYFLWVLFIAIMAVLFLNFLIGLAVEDVSKLQHTAHFQMLRLKVDHVLGTEELFFPVTNCFCNSERPHCDCAVKDMWDSLKKLPHSLKDLCLALFHYFLLWGTEDSDLTTEEEDTDYKINELLKRNKNQDTTVAKLMKKIDDQERMIRKQGEVIKKIEDTLQQQCTSSKSVQDHTSFI